MKRKAVCSNLGRIFAITLLLSATAADPPSFAREKIKIITTILPYREFVEAVGGELVQVRVFIPPGANPHTFELAPGRFKELSQAGLYVKVGSVLEFERVWMDKIIGSNRALAICDSSAGLTLIGMDEGDDPAAPSVVDRGSQGKDPHVWLSPRNARVIVENIRNSLLSIDPENQTTYDRNARDYLRRLTALDQELSKTMAGLKNRAFIVFHPAWGYFARDYGLEQIAIETEGKEPSPRRMARIVEIARARGIKNVLVSPQVNPKIARLIAAEIGGSAVEADPLAGDYFGNLRRVAALLAGQSGKNGATAQ